MSSRTLLTYAATTAASAVVGSLCTDPASAWYRSQRTPTWQPPPLAFPLVWGPLYTSIAVASNSVDGALERSGQHAEAAAYRRAWGVNLLLNAGWSLTFFTLHRRVASIGVAAALAASSADLARRAGAAGPGQRAALVPYAAWCGFATVLTAAVAKLNAGRP